MDQLQKEDQNNPRKYQKIRKTKKGGKNKKKKDKEKGPRESVGDDEENEEEEEDDLDLYSYKWENLTRAEQNQCLHESYQFLVKKYIPKRERKKMKEEKEGKAKENSSNISQPETVPEEPLVAWNGEVIPDVIDSGIDFGHLRS